MFSISGEDVLRRCLGLPFSGEAAGYIDWMQSQGYTSGTMRGRFYAVQSFCRFLDGRETIDGQGLFNFTQEFIEQRLLHAAELGRTCDPERLGAEIRRQIEKFMDYLVSIGRLEPSPSPASTLNLGFQVSLDQFSHCLQIDQGLAQREPFCCALAVQSVGRSVIFWHSWLSSQLMSQQLQSSPPHKPAGPHDPGTDSQSESLCS